MYLFSPNIAHADLNSFLIKVNDQIINPLIGFLFALAVIYFLYGVLQMIISPDNEEVKTQAKSHMIWGVIGLAIMLGVWGILNLILSTLNINKSEINPEDNIVNLKPYDPPPLHPLGTK